MTRTAFIVCVLLASWLPVQNALAVGVEMRPRPQDQGAQTAAKPNTNANTQGLTVEQRLARLERILDSQGLVDMHVRLDELQRELQILRGEVELQSHTLKELKEHQRDLYVDLDRRLSQLERGAPEGGGATSSQPSPSPSAPSAPAASKSSQGGKSATSPAPAASANFADEQKAYQHAFDLLRDLRYEQAVTAFRDFLNKYPDGRYAHIAQYWIAEANYAQRKFKAAIADYQKLISNYPNSPKLAEAKLKIGYSYYELKDYANAEKHLQELIKNYPGTTEAGQARNLLQKIKLKQAG
jgi:tol-pal system protein YbgF